LKLRVDSEAGLSAAVLSTRERAIAAGFDLPDASKLSTAVSELARNILKYAERGYVEIRVLDRPRSGLEVIVWDRGPGIEDVEQAMSDHFSSSGTLGLGLPGVRRLMDEFEIVSSPGEGTRVVIRKWRG
jgi:serine/threonine-protein kinase RsbT